METLLNYLTKYGPLGLVLVVLLYMVLKSEVTIKYSPYRSSRNDEFNNHENKRAAGRQS